MPSKSQIIAIFILILLIIGIFEWMVIDVLRKNILIYQTQINDLKTESTAQTQRYEQAQQDAESTVKQSQTSVRKIMLADVSKNCNQAMSWGIEQAKVFTK